jgi:predicted amidohydrolase
MKILLAQMNSTVGDFEGNFKKMSEILNASHGADLVIFPECALCGYPPQDLLDYRAFAERAEKYSQKLIEEFKDQSFIFGTISTNSGAGRPCQNVAIFSDRGKVLAKYAKRLLPSYDVFDEERFFEPGRTPCIVEFKGKKFALSICEDIWSDDAGTPLQNRYHQNPVIDAKGADYLINISSSPYEQAKVLPKREMLKRIAERHKISLIYLNAVGANDAIIFDGRSYVFSKNGELLVEGTAFRSLRCACSRIKGLLHKAKF